MLHEFLVDNRGELITRCRAKVAAREYVATAEQLHNGVPIFLEQLIQTLRAQQTNGTFDVPFIPLDDRGFAQHALGASATLHGEDMLAQGFTINDVVHNYGDLCQAITDLAMERDAPFSVDEFRTLNRCLDVAIAYAVTAFTFRHDSIEADRHAAEENKRLGFLVHELRNFLGTAKLAFSACKVGALSLSGATGSILGRSLESLEDIISNTVALVRDEQIHHGNRFFSLSEFIAEIEATTELAAIAKACRLTVMPVDSQLAIQGNRAMLLAAVINLLQNAFKFTRLHTEVTLACRALNDSILIEVSDHCGGLGADLVAHMFQPFEQGGTDRTGLGLGLTITRQFVLENGGDLSVRDLPDVGCIFTITLPRHAMPVSQH